jgi:hypothetical protein
MAGAVGVSPAAAQHRPLLTQDPEVIGQGRVLVETGVETGANISYPVSGLTGDRVGVPVGLSVGIGPVAELQIDSGYQWLAIDRRDLAPLDTRVPPGDRVSDVVDAAIALKLRVLAEGARRPSMAVRMVTELPNASNESGLGLDTLNFGASLLAGKTVGGLSVARALTPSVEVVGELTGRRVLFADHAPVGAEPRGQLRGALRYTRGAWRADAGIVVGTTRQDPDIGLTVGMTWVADLFP